MYTRVRAYNTRTDQVGYWYLDGRRRKTIIFFFFCNSIIHSKYLLVKNGTRKKRFGSTGRLVTDTRSVHAGCLILFKKISFRRGIRFRRFSSYWPLFRAYNTHSAPARITRFVPKRII